MSRSQDPRYGTMLEVLTRPNPQLRLTATSTSLTNSKWWEKVQIENVSEWKEFTYETLMSGWGNILQDPTLVKGELEEEITDTQRSISSENKVDSIAEGWNIKAIRASLKLGAQLLHPDSKYDIIIDKHRRKFRTHNGREALPDMGIFYRADKVIDLVVGDNKTSRAWKSHVALGGRVNNTDTALRPINQITTYCKLGNTRYGWIMSDHELLACRVSFVLQRDTQVWKVEYKAIPWDAEGPRTLTVNLSIWWLGMMGTSQRYRAIQPREKMMPINFWWQEKHGDQTVGYTVIHSSLNRLLIRHP